MPGIFETILAFMDKGGNVLWLIACARVLHVDAHLRAALVLLLRLEG